NAYAVLIDASFKPPPPACKPWMRGCPAALGSCNADPACWSGLTRGRGGLRMRVPGEHNEGMTAVLPPETAGQPYGGFPHQTSVSGPGADFPTSWRLQARL